MNITQTAQINVKNSPKTRAISPNLSKLSKIKLNITNIRLMPRPKMPIAKDVNSKPILFSSNVI